MPEQKAGPPFQMQTQPLERNEFIRVESGTAALLYERETEGCAWRPREEPSTASLDPNLRHSICHQAWPQAAFLGGRGHCLTVPGSPPVSHLGLGAWACPWPLSLRSLPRSGFRSFSCCFLPGGPVGRLLLTAFGNMSTREKRCQGHQGARTDRRVVPRCPEPCLPHTFIRLLAQPGGSSASSSSSSCWLVPLCLWRGPGGPLHRCPHRPLPAPASCPPGSSSWRRTSVNMAACTWDPAPPAW